MDNNDNRPQLAVVKEITEEGETKTRELILVISKSEDAGQIVSELIRANRGELGEAMQPHPFEIKEGWDITPATEEDIKELMRLNDTKACELAIRIAREYNEEHAQLLEKVYRELIAPSVEAKG